MPRRRTNGGVRSTAPGRVGDCGGWTDIKQATQIMGGGAVSLLTVGLRAHVLVERSNDGRDPGSNDEGAIIDIADFDQRIRVTSIEDMMLEGEHALLKAALKRFPPPHRVRITVYSDAPAASGVGSSAAVAVALCGALADYNGQKWTPMSIAAQAQALEMQDLGISCGLQDQYGSARGGPAYMEFEYPRVTHYRKLRLQDSFLRELDERLALVYVGGRKSAQFHKYVIRNYESGDKQTQEAMRALRVLAKEASDALEAGDFTRYAEVCTENTLQQKRLSEEVVPPKMEEIIQIGRAHV